MYSKDDSLVRFSVFLVAAIALSTAVAVAGTGVARNGKIAFTSDRDGNREIYLMDPDGSNPTRLTNNSVVDDFPTWSPDGKKIALLSQRASGGFAIFTMNADGTNRAEVASVTYNSPSPWRGFDWRHMSWSPDGNQIAFTDLVGTIGNIFVVNADGSGRRHLAIGFYPAWSPDGSKILFTRGNNPNPFYNLHSINPDGTGLQFIPTTFQSNYVLWDSPPVWSPDGFRIGIVGSDGANSEIYIANADGSNPQMFMHNCAAFAAIGCGANTAYAAWSPDGRTIASAQYTWGSGTTEIFVQDIGSNTATKITETPGSNSNPSWQPIALKNAPFDFDGDGKSDFSVVRDGGGYPVPPTWYITESGGGQMRTIEWSAYDRIVPADYDGDGKTDIAAIETSFPDLVSWHVRSSLTSERTIQFWGLVSDKTVPADYDGDGKADHAVWRPSDGTWHILSSETSAIRVQQWGLPGDKPVPADFDGDGETDLAVFRPSEGNWYVRNSANDSISVVSWGLSGDLLVPGDYSGDGKSDFAVYRPSNNTWYRMHSSDGSIHINSWGLAGDFATPGDYDGDSKLDIAVWRPSNATWYILTSANTIIAVPFGLNGDLPTPSAYLY